MSRERTGLGHDPRVMMLAFGTRQCLQALADTLVEYAVAKSSRNLATQVLEIVANSSAIAGRRVSIGSQLWVQVRMYAFLREFTSIDRDAAWGQRMYAMYSWAKARWVNAAFATSRRAQEGACCMVILL